MSYQWGLKDLFEPPVRHRIFVSYHHSRDQGYYDAFSRAFHDTHEAIYDNSLERRIGSADVDYVIRRSRENYVTGTSCTIALIGAETWGHKYADWEIKATLDRFHGLIGVYLPTAPRDAMGRVSVPDRLHDNVESGYALWTSRDEIFSSADQLNRHIAAANSRPALLINNILDRRLRNAS
jgi:hypothetical protein